MRDLWPDPLRLWSGSVARSTTFVVGIYGQIHYLDLNFAQVAHPNECYRLRFSEHSVKVDASE